MMVTEIPKAYKSDEALRQLFESISSEKVTAAHIAWRTGKVRGYFDKRKKFIAAYESKEMLREKKTICWGCIPWCSCCPGGKYGPEQPVTTTGCCGHCAGVPKVGGKVIFSDFCDNRLNTNNKKQVMALPYYRAKIKRYESKLRGVQEDPKSLLKKTRVGFVSFEKPFMARVACYPVGILLAYVIDLRFLFSSAVSLLSNTPETSRLLCDNDACDTST